MCAGRHELSGLSSSWAVITQFVDLTGGPVLLKAKRKVRHWSVSVHWCVLCSVDERQRCVGGLPAAVHPSALQLAPVERNTRLQKLQTRLYIGHSPPSLVSICSISSIYPIVSLPNESAVLCRLTAVRLYCLNDFFPENIRSFFVLFSSYSVFGKSFPS